MIYSSEKTNSYRPTPWHWSHEPFAAFRGNGWRHRGFLAVAKGYLPVFADAEPTADGYSCPRVAADTAKSKVIKTRKGGFLLVPASIEDDEQIMLLTLRGGFRGDYSRIEAVGCEILCKGTSNAHCITTCHMVVRLTEPKGFVFAETGRRCSTGLVEVFSWAGYKIMSAEQYEKN